MGFIPEDFLEAHITPVPETTPPATYACSDICYCRKHFAQLAQQQSTSTTSLPTTTCPDSVPTRRKRRHSPPELSDLELHRHFGEYFIPALFVWTSFMLALISLKKLRSFLLLLQEMRKPLV